MSGSSRGEQRCWGITEDYYLLAMGLPKLRIAGGNRHDGALGEAPESQRGQTSKKSCAIETDL